MATDREILLTQQQHSDLSSIAQSRSLPAGYVFRVKLILMLAGCPSFHLSVLSLTKAGLIECHHAERIAPQNLCISTYRKILQHVP
jgi:hypothetical protein